MAMAEVSEKMRVPLAVGERNTGIWEFRDFVQLAKPHFLKPDVGLAGGIGHVKKIAAMAESHHIRIAPHNFLSPVATAACVQLGVSTPNWDVLEGMDETALPWSAIVKGPVPIVDGYYIPAGFAGHRRRVRRRGRLRLPFERMGHPPPIRGDGSVALR